MKPFSHDPQRINPSTFGDLQSFPLVPLNFTTLLWIAFTKKQTTTITTLRETLKKKNKTKLLTTYDNLFILNSAMTWHQLFYSLLSNYNDMTCVSPSHRLLIAFYIQPIIQEWMCEQFHSPSTSVAPFSTALDLVSVSETSEAQIQCLIICSQRPLLWW